MWNEIPFGIAVQKMHNRKPVTLEGIWEACSGVMNMLVSERVHQFLLVRVSQQTVMWNLLGWNNFSLSLKFVVLSPRNIDNITVPQWYKHMFIISWVLLSYYEHSVGSAQASSLQSASVPFFFLQVSMWIIFCHSDELCIFPVSLNFAE